MTTATAKPMTKDDPALLDEDVGILHNQLEKLAEEVGDLDYKKSELKHELEERLKFHDTQIVKFNERIGVHKSQRERVADMLKKMGVTVAAAPAVANGNDDLSDLPGLDEIEIGGGNGKKKKASGAAKKTGGGKGDNKYSAKEAVALVAKNSPKAFKVEELANLIQMDEDVGGAGYKTTAEPDAFKTSLMNTAIRPLIKEGVLLKDDSGDETLYFHLDNVDEVLKSLA